MKIEDLVLPAAIIGGVLLLKKQNSGGSDNGGSGDNGGTGTGTQKGSLAVTVSPSTATVLINGDVWTFAGLPAVVNVGTYQYTAYAAGYKSKSGTITIVAGETAYLTVTLEKSDNPGGVIPNYSVSMTPIVANDQHPTWMAFVRSTLKNNSNVPITPTVYFNFYGGSFWPGAGTLLDRSGGMTATIPVGGTFEFEAAHILSAGESDRYDVGAEVYIDGVKIYDRQDDDVFYGF